jgi:hypothetical protein
MSEKGEIGVARDEQYGVASAGEDVDEEHGLQSSAFCHREQVPSMRR